MHLILGSALWGWTITKTTAFQLLDYFYAQGCRQIDAATNYPINKNPADFRRSEKILQEWIQAHGVGDLEIIMKVGSLNNMRGPENNLTKSFLLMSLDDYQSKFGSNLNTFMIHWDNRRDASAIEESLQAFDYAREEGMSLGLSGIKYPEIYFELNRKRDLDFSIQIKHNLLRSDYERYAPFCGKKRFQTYGINAGGLKFDPKRYHDKSSLRVRGGDTSGLHPLVPKLQNLIQAANQKPERPPLLSFNHCGLTFAFHSPDVKGILLGCSRLEQLEDSVQFYRHLLAFDYEDVYLGLSAMGNE